MSTLPGSGSTGPNLPGYSLPSSEYFIVDTRFFPLLLELNTSDVMQGALLWDENYHPMNPRRGGLNILHPVVENGKQFVIPPLRPIIWTQVISDG